MTGATWLGRQRIDLATCASTNDEIARRAADGAAHGLVVTARTQTAGRGRQGRSWYSPSGDNLYYSCLLRPACPPAQAPPLTLAAGLGVLDAIDVAAADAGVKASLKWPNDVLIGGRKVAGVLTEMSTRGERLEHVIIGIGVNLHTRAFPDELADIATSLHLCGVTVERAAFIDELCQHLELWFDRFLAHGPQPLTAAWLARARHGGGTLGRTVRASAARGLVTGQIRGMATDGRLQVEDADGRIHLIAAGVVEYLG